MFTSYFYKNIYNPNAVSIASYAPKEFKGRAYKKLAPTFEIRDTYKRTGDFKLYEEMYYNIILSKLDPETIYKELGKDAIMLCYEACGKPCHRHLASAWLSNALNIIIEEI